MTTAALATSPQPTAAKIGELSSDWATASGDAPLHVVWLNQHAAAVGGAERYILQTAKRLAERGWRNTLLYEVAGRIEPEFTSVFDAALPQVQVAEQLQELAGDVVYAHRVESLDTVRTLAAAATPTLRFVHDHKLFCLREHKYTALGNQTCTRRTGWNCYSCLGFVGRGASGAGFRLNWLHDLHANQQANQQLAGLAVGSQYMAEHAGLHGFERDRVHVLPLFAPPAAPPVAAPEATPATERSADQLLFAGALVRGKGLDLLLQAIARCDSNPRLTVAGEGRQERELRQLTETLTLGDRVRFVGRLNPAELTVEMSRASCVVVPSRSPETFGLSGLEALCQGVPVIASDVGGMGEWLKPGVTGLSFPAGDIGALSAAIDWMIQHPADARALGEAGAQLCRERFTPEHHLDKLQAVLHCLARQEAPA